MGLGTPKSRFRFNICFRISKFSSLRRTILLYDTIIIICTRSRTGLAGSNKVFSSLAIRRYRRAFPSCPWHFLYFTPKARKFLRYFGPCRAFPPCSWHLENKGASSSIISPDELELCVLVCQIGSKTCFETFQNQKQLISTALCYLRSKNVIELQKIS